MFAPIAVLLAGCAGPAANPGLRTIGHGPDHFYVVSHGRHTGLAVKRADLLVALPSLTADFGGASADDQTRWLELGWGDEKFYREPDAGLGLALRAVLVPTSSVLHVVELKKAPPQAFPKAEVVRVEVSAQGYLDLIAYVAVSFATAPNAEPVRIGPGLYGTSSFYGARGQFHATNTCNTWIARAIDTSGYPLEDATVITAEGLLDQLQ